ncbi:hypothetical protein, partial [Almyronema epifaneia]
MIKALLDTRLIIDYFYQESDKHNEAKHFWQLLKEKKEELKVFATQNSFLRVADFLRNKANLSKREALELINEFIDEVEILSLEQSENIREIFDLNIFDRDCFDIDIMMQIGVFLCHSLDFVIVPESCKNSSRKEKFYKLLTQRDSRFYGVSIPVIPVNTFIASLNLENKLERYLNKVSKRKSESSIQVGLDYSNRFGIDASARKAQSLRDWSSRQSALDLIDVKVFLSRYKNGIRNFSRVKFIGENFSNRDLRQVCFENSLLEKIDFTS